MNTKKLLIVLSTITLLLFFALGIRLLWNAEEQHRQITALTQQLEAQQKPIGGDDEATSH